MADPSAPPQLKMSTAVNDTDRGTIIQIVGWLCLVASILFYAARLRIRWPLKSLFGQDDAVCTAAMAFSVVQTAIVLLARYRGFGTRQNELSDDEIAFVQKLIWGSDLFFVVAVCLSKLAVVSLFRRFSASPERIRTFTIFMGAIIIYGVVGLFITALRQDILHPWRYNSETATSTLHRWIAFGAMGIALDVAALLAPVYLTWGIRIDFREKMRVNMAFASRAPIIVFTVLRLIAISKARADSFTWSYVTPEVYTQLEMHYGFVAATIPCVQIFLKVWNTSFLAMGLEQIDERAYMEHTTAKGTYAMGSLSESNTRSKARGTSSKRRTGMRSSQGPWSQTKDYGISQATVGGGKRDGGGDASSESSQKAIVVKQTVDVDVRRGSHAA